MNDSRGDGRPRSRDDDRSRKGSGKPTQPSRGSKPHPSLTPKRAPRAEPSGEHGKDRGRPQDAPHSGRAASDDRVPGSHRPRQEDRKAHSQRNGSAGRQERADEHSDRRETPRDEPEIAADAKVEMLPRQVRNELKTLSEENQTFVALHLVMAGRLIDEDPALALRHATAAARKGGRIGVVRETIAIAAYANGDFALALRELRTYRRLTGTDEHLAMMVDCERGLGRPDRGLELGRSVPRGTLANATQVEVAIAMSGARLDLGQTEAALRELEIAQLDATKAFTWSPDLFAAYALVLEDLGRNDESRQWYLRATVAAEALEEAGGISSAEGSLSGYEVVDLEDL